MAINIYQLWLDLKSNTNTKQGGQLRVRDYNNWVNQISIQLFNEKFAAWEKDQMIIDNLSRPFLESKSFITKKTALNFSLLSFPNDYSYFSSARVYKTSDKVVKCPEPGKKANSAFADLCEVTATKVNNAQWGAVCTNKIIPPTLDRVFITQYEGGFKVAPKEIGYVTLDYLRLPKKAKLVFLPGLNQTYDSVNSIDLEWNETVINEFLARLQIAYSEFIREQFLYSTGQNKKDTTV